MVSTARTLFDRLMAVLAGLCCATMLGVVLASSFSRYVFNAPFQWSEELAKYAMVYGTMFGAVLAYNRGQHMRFTLLADLLGGRWAARLGKLVDASVIAVGGILVVSGYLFMVRRGGILSSGMGIRMIYANAAIMIGGACLLVAAALDILDRRGGGTTLPAGDAQ